VGLAHPCPHNKNWVGRGGKAEQLRVNESDASAAGSLIAIIILAG